MIDVLAMSKSSCKKCLGLGRYSAPRRGMQTCGCVYRTVFRVCMRRYEAARFAGLLRGAVDTTPRWNGARGLSPEPLAFRLAAYAADIELTARRALSGWPMGRAIFWYHCLHAQDWRDCVRLIESQVGHRIDRGDYWHEFYRVEEMLGRVFLELRPYGLYPKDYFAPPSKPAAPYLYVRHM